MIQGFMTVKRACDLLGCSRQYIHAEIGRGSCPSVSVGNIKLIPEKAFRVIYGARIEAEAAREAGLASSFELEAGGL